MGIVNTPDMQIVFSDTPGVLKPNYKLQESMLAFSESALTDADVLLYVTDVVENPEKNRDFLDKVAKMQIPVLLLINKIDLLADDTTPDAKKAEDGKKRKGGSAAKGSSATQRSTPTPKSPMPFGIGLPGRAGHRPAPTAGRSQRSTPTGFG